MRKLKHLFVLTALLLASTAFSTTTLALTGASAPDDQQLSVHFIDVGQGDSILIQLPDKTTALIDGGNNDSKAANYLQSIGITRITLVACPK